MTGYQSKRAMAQDKLAQPEQEPDRFCDANCTWSDHHPDCKYGTQAPLQRTWVEPTCNEWFEWWRVSAIADSTEAEIDFHDFLIIAQAVAAKSKELNT